MALCRPFPLALAMALFAAGGCADPDATPGADAGRRLDASVFVPGADGGSGPVKLDAGQSGGGLTSVELEPASATLTTDGMTPARQRFMVWGTNERGERVDVTASASLGLSSATLGALSGNELVSALHGAAGRVTATVSGRTAEATVTVRLVRQARDENAAPPLPMDPAAVIAGATDDPSRAPSIVYPNAGVLLPPNLGSIEVHWLPGNPGNRLFQIQVSGERLDIRVFTRCAPVAAGCVYTLAGDLWDGLGASGRGLAPLSITVTGVSEDGRAKGTSAPLEISVAARPVVGALYYWTTSRSGSILRIQFGSSDTPERFFPFEGTQCFGCHAMSPNGERMTLTVGGNNKAQLAILDVGARRVDLMPSDAKQDQFQAWDPTSEKFAAVYNDVDPQNYSIRIRDGSNGDVLETINVGVEPDHPDWSPRGDRIVFTQVGLHRTTQRPGMGGLSYVEQAADFTWSAPQVLMPAEAGKNRYYPSFSPDAQIVVFNESTCPRGNYSEACDADSDPSATLWAIPAAGGAPVRLDRANAPGVQDSQRADLTNSYPRWAPFVDNRSVEGTGRVMWMTFSSRRNYGLRSVPGTNTLLWMVAVDPDAVVAGSDGSFPAFALPFQDLTTSNHVAQWAAQIAPDPGGNPGMCLQFGDPCDPADDRCCTGSSCSAQGGGVFRCKPAL